MNSKGARAGLFLFTVQWEHKQRRHNTWSHTNPLRLLFIHPDTPLVLLSQTGCPPNTPWWTQIWFGTTSQRVPNGHLSQHFGSCFTHTCQARNYFQMLSSIHAQLLCVSSTYHTSSHMDVFLRNASYPMEWNVQKSIHTVPPLACCPINLIGKLVMHWDPSKSYGVNQLPHRA